MVESAMELKDWGVSADIQCYWQQEEDILTTEACIKVLLTDTAALQQEQALTME